MTIAADCGAEAFFRDLRGAFARPPDLAPFRRSSPQEPDATRRRRTDHPPPTGGTLFATLYSDSEEGCLTRKAAAHAALCVVFATKPRRFFNTVVAFEATADQLKGLTWAQRYIQQSTMQAPAFARFARWLAGHTRMSHDAHAEPQNRLILSDAMPR